MKNMIKISLIILALSRSFSTDAQTFSIDDSSSPVIENLQNREGQLNFFSPQDNTKNVSTANSVYIQQIGNNNDIVSNTQSFYSNIGLFQKGNNNEILLGITAGAINENVLQLGINNSVIDLNTKGSILHKNTVFQKGHNQNLIMLGANSISNNMIISMQGRNQTILVRNFKN